MTGFTGFTGLEMLPTGYWLCSTSNVQVGKGAHLRFTNLRRAPLVDMLNIERAESRSGGAAGRAGVARGRGGAPSGRALPGTARMGFAVRETGVRHWRLDCDIFVLMGIKEGLYSDRDDWVGRLAGSETEWLRERVCAHA